MNTTKAGAVSYVLWGLLHIGAAIQQFMLSSHEIGQVRGKLQQGAWDLLFFSAFAIVVAVRYIWRDDKLGYWLNLIVVSAADIGFIIFVLLPGHVDIFPGILGPILWILGAALTTMGMRGQSAA